MVKRIFLWCLKSPMAAFGLSLFPPGTNKIGSRKKDFAASLKVIALNITYAKLLNFRPTEME